MVNFLFNSWLKNVNNWRITSSLTCDNISTFIQKSIKEYKNSSKSNFNKLTNNYYSTILSTYNNSNFNLLNKSFTYFPLHLLLELKKKK